MKNNNSSLHQIKKGVSLFVNYGIHSANNRKRIKDVLNGEFKPLFGIDSKLYINGHRHIDFLLEKTLRDFFLKPIENMENKNVSKIEIEKIIKSKNFINTLSIYKEDINHMVNIIKSGNISLIGIEDSLENVQSATSTRRVLVNRMIDTLKNIGLEDQDIWDIALVSVGPGRYIYLSGKFPGISIIGLEGDVYKDNIDSIKKGLEIYISDSKNRDNVLSTGDLINNTLGTRNIQIAQNLEKYRGKEILLVIGDKHADEIKKLMGNNWKVKVSHNI